MNCSNVRNRILASSNPSKSTGKVGTHLNDCAECRAWQQMFLAIEAAVVASPIPELKESRKERFIAEFLSPKFENLQVSSKELKKLASPAENAIPTDGKRVAKYWPVGLIAASLLAAVIVISNRRTELPLMVSAPQGDPMLEKAVAAKVKLDQAKSTSDRMKVLADLADDLHSEASAISMVAPGGEMASLARLYESVVADALVGQANDLAKDPTISDKRAALTPFIDRLSKTEGEANRRAAEAPVGSDEPLLAIAKAASTSRAKIAVLREKSS